MAWFKGELNRFFLSAQSFYWPQTKTCFKRKFSPKSPKVGQKSGQRVKNWPNKNQVASDLLRLMAPSLGMTMEQTNMSPSERTCICSISIFFICFMIWINFHHKTGRVGRRPTEPLFFSFMAGWEKERGQWFQHALVGIPFDPIPLKCLSYHFHILHLFFEWPKLEKCTLRQMATTWASRGRELKRRCPESFFILETQPSVWNIYSCGFPQGRHPKKIDFF